MISRDRPSPRHVLLWVLLSALFATYYVLHSRVGSDSSIERHAELLIDPPFVFRVMIPWVLSKLLPMSWLDMTLTRTVIAAAFSLSSILLMPAFMARVLGRDLSAIERRRACRAIFIVLIAHYLLPRNLKFYYVYDLPAITFYELCFLALTDRRNWVRWVGVATSTLFAFNRETIGIAVVHAAGWHIAQLWPRERRSPNFTAGVFLPLLFSCVGILFVRTWLAQQLNHSVQQSFSWMEGDQLRLLANLIRMGTKFHHAISILWFGAGAIVWLPKKWKVFDTTFKIMVWVSLPVFIFFCIVGNFVELRMFSELVPLLAVGFAWQHPSSQSEVK